MADLAASEPASVLEPVVDQTAGIFRLDTTVDKMPPPLVNAPPEAEGVSILGNILPASSEAWLDPNANVAGSTDHTLDDWLREILRDYGMPVDGDSTAWSGAGDLGFSMDHLYGGL